MTLGAARKAGLVGRKRALDSTLIFDAVATMDAVTLIRSGIRGVLRVAGDGLEVELGVVIGRDDAHTRQWVNPSVITTTRAPVRSWWMRWPRTRWPW